MGDHRADIKIQFTMHGQTYMMDSYINWFDDGTGMDARVERFFRESVADAMSRYEAQVAKYFEQERTSETEQREREELARLKAKYDSTAMT